MNASALPRVLLPQEVAAWLGTTTRNVLKMVEAGEIPHVRLPDESVVFEVEPLQAWIERRRVTSLGAAPDVA